MSHPSSTPPIRRMPGTLGNTAGTRAALAGRPASAAAIDDGTGYVVLELPAAALTRLARAVHTAGPDSARAFARAALGDEAGARALLALSSVRDALTLTLTLDDVVGLLDDLSDAHDEARELAADAGQRHGPDPDRARELAVDDDLLDLGDRPVL